jgi:hypothetical protein
MTTWRDEDAPRPRQPYHWVHSHVGNKLERLQADSRPATDLEVAEQLARLIGCFNASSADNEVYGAELIDLVAEAKPTIGDIQEARRWLLRTSVFRPAIAEVLNALSLAQEERLLWIRSIPKPASTAPLEPPKPQIEHKQAININVVNDLAETDRNYIDGRL